MSQLQSAAGFNLNEQLSLLDNKSQMVHSILQAALTCAALVFALVHCTGLKDIGIRCAIDFGKCLSILCCVWLTAGNATAVPPVRCVPFSRRRNQRRHDVELRELDTPK